MTETLATVAKLATSAPANVSLPRKCMAFVRECVQHVHGHKYDEYFYKATAEGSRKAFEKSPYVVPLERGSKPGDILFLDTPGDDAGHVCIRIPGNKVAENSTVHGAAKGYRGQRPFSLVSGRVRLIVRLP